MLTLREVAALTGGTLFAPDGGTVDVASLHVDAVSTDSRALPAGALFVALTGDRFDGHAFIDGLAGARAVLVGRSRRSSALPSIEVDDVRCALGDLAAGWRLRHRMPLAVVTGSNGKTTTKEMIASIFAAAFGRDDVCATRGNLNNDIGVPLTLLSLRTHHRAAVVELGMNHPGETARLAAIAGPDIALVVNAQREHQEFMQTVAAVAEEHALAIAALGDDGVAVFPADDAYADVWRLVAGRRRVVDFVCRAPGNAAGGSTDDAAHAAAARVVGRAHLAVDDTVLHLAHVGDTVTARLAVTGFHNAHNATAAAAVAVAVGIPLDAIGAGLETFRPARGRTERVVVGDVVVIDDSYNANPDSMRAAIDLLATHAAPRLMVMGDMGEVGGDGPRFHAEVGAYARARGIESLFAVGAASAFGVAAFGPAGRHFHTVEPLIAAVHDWIAECRNGATASVAGAIVVKGSRFMRMERVVAALQGRVVEESH